MNKTFLLKAMAVTLAMGTSMNAIAGLFGLGGTSWKEEVLLHDGMTIVVERWHKRGGRHEITSGPPVKEQSITFNTPGSNKQITWRDEYSEEVGSANFQPVALHVMNGIPYIVVSLYGCIAYNKWGRPNPPYVIFKNSDDSWQRISMAELPSEFQTINLVIGTSNKEKSLEKLGKVSVAEVDRMNRDYKQPELKSILRDPLPEKRIIQMCGDMVLYRGHWIMRNSELDKQRIDRLLDHKK